MSKLMSYPRFVINLSGLGEADMYKVIYDLDRVGARWGSGVGAIKGTIVEKIMNGGHSVSFNVSEDKPNPRIGWGSTQRYLMRGDELIITPEYFHWLVEDHLYEQT